jgi:hypothetical protein
MKNKVIVDARVKKALTKHQLCIFKDLREAVRKGIIITKDHIVELYLTSRYGQIKRFEIELKEYYPIPHTIKRTVEKEEYKMLAEVRNAALGWYKSNLGSVIVKGKIFVLPPIEG